VNIWILCRRRLADAYGRTRASRAYGDFNGDAYDAKREGFDVVYERDVYVLDVSQDTDRRFMTSDHPVIMTNGLGREDGHFALAISPTHLFGGFYEPRNYECNQRIAPRRNR